MTLIPAHLQRCTIPPAPPRTRYKAVLRGPRYRPQRYVVRASALPQIGSQSQKEPERFPDNL